MPDGKLQIAVNQIEAYDNIARQVLIKYMSYYSDMETDAFYDKIINKKPNLKGDVMTVAEQWKQQGHQEGLQQGMQQGMESIPSIVSMQLFYKFPLSLIANLDPTGCSIKRCVIGVLCVQILCSIGLCVFS